MTVLEGLCFNLFDVKGSRYEVDVVGFGCVAVKVEEVNDNFLSHKIHYCKVFLKNVNGEGLARGDEGSVSYEGHTGVLFNGQPI